jgi:UDP-N-acetylmuramoyl-tripeptide--D-alanyl-D-alanine ligase
MLIDELYRLYLRHPDVQTDTRKLKPGDIFFALKGPNFNGNAFAKQAIEQGATLAVIDEKEFEIPGKTFLVPDALTALQLLAKHHREQFKIPFIAITGSNGKTTTKEVIHAVLSTTFKTYTTEGNLNNHIGVPLTILKIKSDAQMAVIEMGANHQKEIESYCRIALPTHGLITNCGKAHLEGFGSEEGVRKGKGELFDFLRANNGTAFIMQDYAYLRQMSEEIPSVIRYGTNGADIEGLVEQREPYLTVKMKKGLKGIIKTRLVGDYNLPNILAAVTIGKHFGVADEKITSAIENYVPSNSRSQLIEKGTNKIILDAYNANPSSMILAIENFARTNPEKKVLLLGAMAELGSGSLQEHEEIIALIKKYPWKAVALVGGDFCKLKHPYHSFENAGEAKRWLKEKKFEHTGFLLKGSRSIQMEKVFEP